MRPSTAPVAIAALVASDRDDVAGIYADGIVSGLATFETEVPTWEAWDRDHMADHRLLARDAGRAVGWAALALLAALVESSEAGGVWTLEAGILPENEASVRMHERCGFRVVGRRERLGRMRGVWRDVLLLERRSAAVG